MTDMDKMIEKVAEAIYDFLDERFPDGALPGGTQLFADDHLDAEFKHEAGCEEMARAIMSAYNPDDRLREASPAMIEAGIKRCAEFGLKVDDGSNEWLADVYRTMTAAEHPLARMVRLDEEQGLYDDEALSPLPQGDG